MGYTHYWKHGPIDEHVWDTEFLPAVKEILQHPLCALLAGPDGTGQPCLDSDSLAFNGKSPRDYERFILSRAGTDFSFCKTQMRPYDDAVVAMLSLAAAVLPGFSWSSDGGSDAHQVGLELLFRATGITGSPAVE